MTSEKKYWLISIIILIIISFLPGHLFQFGKYDNLIKSIGHLVLYFVITYYTLLVFKIDLKLKHIYSKAFLFVILLALLDEFHQKYVAHRHATCGDLLLDLLAIFLAGLFYKKSVSTFSK